MSQKINYRKIIPFFYKWEGGLSRNQNDSAKKHPCPLPWKDPKDGKVKTGWHTNKGVTYSAWVGKFGRNNDERFMIMSDEDWGVIFKEKYWDKVKGDDMPVQFVSDVLVAWAWGSGAVTAIKQMQRHLKFKKADQDGKIGNQTLGAIRVEVEKNPNFFVELCNTREEFFRFISDPKNARNEEERIRFKNNIQNLRGWLNRLNQFRKEFAP